MATVGAEALESGAVWQDTVRLTATLPNSKRRKTKMATIARAESISVTDPAHQAYQILHIGFTAAPILFGLDKFFNLMVDWEKYVAPWVVRIIGNAHTFMLGVGIVEIVAGLVVAFKPRWGAYIVALWLLGIIFNLLTYSGFYDIALRDFGLLLAALALGRLSERYSRV